MITPRKGENLVLMCNLFITLLLLLLLLLLFSVSKSLSLSQLLVDMHPFYDDNYNNNNTKNDDTE